jgi:hypothetical protein
MADSRVQEILRDHGELARDRAGYEGTWNDLARRLAPTQELYRTSTPTPRPDAHPEVYDGTPRGASERFAAALDGLLTPAGQKWHTLAPEGYDKGENPALEKALEAKRDLLFRIRYGKRSAFAWQNGEVYGSLGVFGNGCLMVDDWKGRGITYQAIPLRDLYWGTSALNHPDRVHRVIRWKGYQALQFFDGQLPTKLNARVEKDKNTALRFLHAVYPNEERVPYRAGPDGMAYRSCYVSLDDEELVREGGFRTMPYCIARYRSTAGEAYGRGPGHAVHPAIKMANAIKRGAIIYANKAAEPPLGARGDDVRVDVRPGAINPGTVDEMGRPLVVPLSVTGQFQVAETMLDMERQDIRDAFLDTLWQILVEKPTATATEVLERAQEKGVLLSPTAGILQGQYLGAVIERELDIMGQSGLLDDLGPDLSGAGGLLVEYDSPLTQAQRAGESAGALRWLQAMAAITQFDPTARFVINGEELARLTARGFGVPGRALHTSDEIKAMQDQALQAQQLQTIIQAAPAASAAAANLARVPGALAGTAAAVQGAA